MTKGVKDAMGVRHIMDWYGYKQTEPTTVYCDNLGAVRNTEEGAERSKSKHLDIQYMFLRDLVKLRLITVKHVSTHQQAADILTKGLGRHKHEMGCEALGLFKGSVCDELLSRGE